MISNADVQECIVQHLKSHYATWNTILTTSDEIRELQWQGINFIYPNIRVGDFTQSPAFGIECSGLSEVTFSIRAFTEEDSSQNCDILIYEVTNFLHNTQAHYNTKKINVKAINFKSAYRVDEQTWMSIANFKGKVQTL